MVSTLPHSLTTPTLRPPSVYNASLLAVKECHPDLRIFRVLPDTGLPKFLPGQYTSVGLGNWEPRVAGVDEEHLDSVRQRRMCLRAYSFSCSILDQEGRLRRPHEFPYLELYIALVRHADRRPPALTPRLFRLKGGDRLYIAPHVAGHYTLAGVRPDDDVFFFATGTGEAPHNAMIAELLASGHRGRIVSAVSVRRKIDAGYRAVHEELMWRYPKYHYFVQTTREPENLDPGHSKYVGKLHLQDLVQSGRIEDWSSVPLDPAGAHAFLCGSPQMIGAPAHARPSLSVERGSMLALLRERGFRPDEAGRQGNVHFERYW